MSEPDSHDDLLYHYTDSGGLAGIVGSSTLWATNVAFLNDTQEMRFGANLLAAQIEKERVLQFRWGTDSLSPGENLRADQLRQYFEETYVPERVIHGPYVVCFSREGNDLGQWRGYARAGYAIGFDRTELFDQTKPSSPPKLEIRPVIYGNDALSKAYSYALQIVEYAKTIEGDRRLTDDEVAKLAAPPETDVPYFKHAAFAAEAEERLIVNHLRDVKFRSSDIGLTPYREVDINLSAIREIVIGPGPNQQIRSNAVRVLLDLHFPCSDIKIIESEIPFRG